MPRKVFVTGMGMISAIGIGIEETLNSIINLKTGIGKLSLFRSIHGQIPVAEVRLSKGELAALAGIYRNQDAYSRNALFALIAAEQVYHGKAERGVGDRRTGLVMATTVGGMDVNERYYRSLTREGTYKDYIRLFDSADCTEKVATRFDIRNYVTTISTACSSSANSIMLGARLIKNNKLDRVLAGGSDSLTKFTLNGFNALEILSPTGCRPFDLNRNGLTIGEGAAMLMLEAEEKADPENVICEITGYANVNEAYHQTASAPGGTGAFMAMEKALDLASLKPDDIDYINAHGTGTEVNDLAEGKAIEDLFRNSIPPVSSTKAFTGHTLGAAGAMEAVLSALAIMHQIVLPGLNFAVPMPELGFIPVQKTDHAAIHHVISNSFGFGGNNTSLVFSKA
ncbi:MAG: beta-ketoacyl-[acyl-carrier-protein] synthase family protein [Bacteroidales bacterium]|nr:beta-ketoacyl-[acyl-carrier-protein] synthase family protein [Bacteroidales bacterium]